MRRLLGIAGAQGWGGGCLWGNREESSGGHLIVPTDGEPPKGLKGHSVLPEDGLPEEVGWRSLQHPQGRMPSLET